MTPERPSPDEQDQEVSRYMILSEPGFRNHFMELLLDRERNAQKIARMLITARYRLMECRVGTALYRTRENTLRYVYVAYKGGDDVEKEGLDRLAALEDEEPFHAPDPYDELFNDIILHMHTTDEQ